MGGTFNEFSARLPLYLVGSDAELDYNRRDLPPTVHYVGPCIWLPPPDAETAAWLDRIPADRPWVHATEATLHYGDPFILRAAAQGLAGANVEAILTTGRQRDPETLDLGGPLAPNVHLTRWLSHADLMPRCAAMVTAGGTSTILSSLRAGVPLVVVPTNWDKPDNARRVVEAGVGVRLAPKKCTPDGLRAAVEEVLGDPKYRANAERVAERLARAQGPARAAELLEELARSVASPGRARPRSRRASDDRRRAERPRERAHGCRPEPGRSGCPRAEPPATSLLRRTLGPCPAMASGGRARGRRRGLRIRLRHRRADRDRTSSAPCDRRRARPISPRRGSPALSVAAPWSTATRRLFPSTTARSTRSSCSMCSSTSPSRALLCPRLQRVLRPGGVIVLSVPHRGLLAPLDSLNVYPGAPASLPLVAAGRAG